MPATKDLRLAGPGPQTPEEREREVAAILAKGILRLRTPLVSLSEVDSSSSSAIPGKLSESRRNPGSDHCILSARPFFQVPPRSPTPSVLLSDALWAF